MHVTPGHKHSKKLRAHILTLLDHHFNTATATARLAALCGLGMCLGCVCCSCRTGLVLSAQRTHTTIIWLAPGHLTLRMCLLCLPSADMMIGYHAVLHVSCGSASWALLHVLSFLLALSLYPPPTWAPSGALTPRCRDRAGCLPVSPFPDARCGRQERDSTQNHHWLLRGALRVPV